ncbi:MAG: 4-hydroxy-tetrahydrodipicolinate reductase [Clostridia bacterium]|nr:4-hydroxy-tetrahydrodipicolinate reductase [Clostridia bacterium]
MNPCRILISGCSGRLGSVIAKIAADSREITVACGVDRVGTAAFPILDSFSKVDVECDVIIDVSHHTVAPELMEFAVSKNIPVVVCTTGHTEEEEAAIRNAAEKIPVLKSRNMSLGINVMMELVRRAAAALGDGYDIEVVEAHHSKKLDAPSGTALMLADAAKEVREDAEYVYDRTPYRRERDKREIGIHSVRGGTIVGEHSVIFAGLDEVITLSHSAGSRDLFASGAIKAALFVKNANAGFYTMSDVVRALV